MNIGLIQQGDVLFHRIDQLPEGAVSKAVENDMVIFARGEATGHHHSAVVEMVNATPNLDFYEMNGVLYLKVFRDTEVTHQEHNAVVLTPGFYRCGLVREIDPFTDETHYVKD